MTESPEDEESRDASHDEDSDESPVRAPDEPKTEAHGGTGAEESGSGGDAQVAMHEEGGRQGDE